MRKVAQGTSQRETFNGNLNFGFIRHIHVRKQVTG